MLPFLSIAPRPARPAPCAPPSGGPGRPARGGFVSFAWSPLAFSTKVKSRFSQAPALCGFSAAARSEVGPGR